MTGWWIGLNAARTQDGRPQIDGATALLDGERIYSLPEELVSRRRHDGNVWRSLDHVLRSFSIPLGAVGRFLVSTCGEPVPEPGAPVHLRTDGRLTLQDLGVDDRRITWCESHHESHAWEAVYAAQTVGTLRLPTLIHVADRVGQPGEHQSVFLYDGGARLRLIARDPVAAGRLTGSGLAYDMVTRHLGWRENIDAGKTMALAGLAQPPARDEPAFMVFDGHATHQLLPDGERTAAALTHWCPANPQSDLRLSAGAILAARLQAELEQAVVARLATLAADHNPAQILFGGGMAANCKLIGRVALEFSELTVQGSLAPGDTGQGIGNIVGAFVRQNHRLPERFKRGGFWPGTKLSPGVQAPIGDCGFAMKREGSEFQIVPVPLDADKAAAHIASGGILAVCVDDVEPGPRALGLHSFFADARTVQVAKTLNREIKRRESFQPFGALMEQDFACRCFGQPIMAPFMDVALPAPALVLRDYPGAVHQDGSIRFQTTSCITENSFASRLLRALSNDYGIDLIINTSLNFSNQPLIVDLAELRR